jgi:transcriptional regulator with XRE-family HTH domain
MQAQNSTKVSALFERLQRLRRLQGLTWNQVGQKLGVGVGMLMMVKTGRRNLSEKALARLEWAEVEAGLRARSRVSEAARAVGKRLEAPSRLLTERDIQNGYFDFMPQYRPSAKEAASPEPIRLNRPDFDGRARLGMAVAKSFDSEIVVLACLPDPYRREDFLESLTASSRSKLHDCAMALVFGKEWRATIARLAVESRIGDRSVIDQILGRK